MRCPVCQERDLEKELTKEGVEVDICGECGGLWLDQGELFLFAKNPKPLAAQLDKAIQSARPGVRQSPRSQTPMQVINFPDGPELDYCPETGGLWFDPDELEQILAANKNISITPTSEQWDGSVKAEARSFGRRRFGPAGKSTTAAPPFSTGGAALEKGGPLPPLPPLPNLLVRSTLTLTGLYAMLTLMAIIAVEYIGVSLNVAFWSVLGIAVIQFLISPYIMDWSLRFLYKVRWVQFGVFPEHLKVFVDELCKKKKLKRLRFGIIEDGAPQAFTYGHHPGNARIVVSQGTLDLLEPEELEAVVAHEIGHAAHWDILLMTIAQLVPLFLYYAYRTLQQISRTKDGRPAFLGAMAAYVLYIISEYMVLWFSRTREYHADRFSGAATGNPSALAAALAKIAYGLAGSAPPAAKKDGKDAKRKESLEAIGAMGIFDADTARTMAIVGYTERGEAEGTIDIASVKGAMRWDLWNPWAKWYELHSTHPLVANRLQRLGQQARHMGQEPYVNFDEKQPESYWDDFLLDLSIHLLPLMAIVLVPGWFILTYRMAVNFDQLVGFTLAILGLALLIRFYFVYESRFFPLFSVAALLKKVKVSGIRPIPCTLKGKIIGRGIPGYIFSEDFIMRDQTGIIFLDYSQPLAIWEFFFGLLKAGKLQGKEVIVEGWYRRSPVPYIEIRSFECDGVTRKSWTPFMYKLTAFVVSGIGIAWLVWASGIDTLIKTNFHP